MIYQSKLTNSKVFADPRLRTTGLLHATPKNIQKIITILNTKAQVVEFLYGAQRKQFNQILFNAIAEVALCACLNFKAVILSNFPYPKNFLIHSNQIYKLSRADVCTNFQSIDLFKIMQSAAVYCHNTFNFSCTIILVPGGARG